MDEPFAMTNTPPPPGPWVGNLGTLAAALAKAQGAFGAVPKSRTVTVETRTGGHYTFSYAPLDVILDAVRKPLSENGLAITQVLTGSDLITILAHESGACLMARIAVPRGEGVQAFGSAVTYLRRYSIQAMLGIAAEEDDDGSAAVGNTSTPTSGSKALERRVRAATKPAAVPEAAPAASVAGEPTPGAPEKQGDGAAAAPDPTTSPTTPETTSLTTPPTEPTGLTFEEFKSMAREKSLLNGFVFGVARRLWPEREFKVVGDIMALTGEERFTLWLGCIADA